MIDPDHSQSHVSTIQQTLCRACNSPKVIAGARALGSVTVHQQYTCEDCQYEFTGVFELVGYSPGRLARCRG